MLHAVILAGGSGTRLWPLSREHYPKQFLQLLGPHTLLQQTVLRVRDFIAADRMWVVTGKEQEFLVRSQLSQLSDFESGRVRILVEPEPRNTAAAIGLAAVHIRNEDPYSGMLVLPADHWIENQSVFMALIQSVESLAQQDWLVTLGITPDRPETGYGYIQAAEEKISGVTVSTYRVARFVEKPDLFTAQQYVAHGAFYWNAGIFLWKTATILDEIAMHLPVLSQGIDKIAAHLDTDESKSVTAAVYKYLPSISIDFGVLEKSNRMIVVPADIGWSDLGDWSAIYRLSAQDERGNTLGPRVIDLDSENSFVHSNGRLIATVGLKDTVVVDAGDALLICAKDRIQEVKTIVQDLHKRGTEETSTHRTMPRPWGTYTILEEGVGFKVKRVVVNPGAALSLQRHQHRSEHWIVVTGSAKVINGDRQWVLEVGQSTYVPQGVVHRIANPGVTPLEVIEVQTGSYLGEDDIIRLDDLYQRVVSLPN